MAVQPSRWGAKIGPRIAILVSQSIVHTHSKLAALKHKIAMSVFHAISDEISDEVDVTLGPLIRKIHDAIDEKHPAYPVIHFMATERGQLKAIVGSGVQMSGLLGALGNIMNNELAPAAYDVIRSNPHLIPPVQDIVNMAAAGIVGEDQVNGVANANGTSNGWAAAYLELARQYPTIDVGLDLLRRGLLTTEDFAVILQRSGMPSQYWDAMLETRNLPVSVADAALAVLRGNIDFNTGGEIAAENGFDLDAFKILLDNTGEPPGIMQLLEAYRRHFIDEATLKKGILQSRVRDEWIPTLEQLRYTPMSVADAVNAVVQAQMTQSEAERIADENGLTPGAVDTLVKTAGEPLSRTEMEELFNRGLVTEAAVKQALRESRLKDKYVDAAFDLHSKVLPVFSLQRALRYGGVGEADAIRIAMESGYSKADSTVIVNAGNAERLQTYKDRVIAAVMTLYEDNIMTQASAAEVIRAMDYSADMATFIMQASEFRRNAKVLTGVVTAIKSKYLQRHITETETINYLNEAGVPASSRDQLMKEWNIEHDAYTRTLTEAQVVKAVKDKLIDPANGLSRLEYMGYSKVDAQLLIDGA